MVVIYKHKSSSSLTQNILQLRTDAILTDLTVLAIGGRGLQNFTFFEF